jgi:signal transduction histidine kinase
MQPHETQRWEVWRRREGLMYRLVPHLTLAVSTLLALAVPAPGQAPRPVLLGIVAGTACWALWFTGRPADGPRPPRRSAVGYAGLLTLAAVLVLLCPWYGFFAWVGYPLAFQFLTGRWIIAGVAGTALVSATSQSGGLPSDGPGTVLWLSVVLFNLALAGAVGWFGLVSARQNQSRQEMIEQLAETNRRLAATMRENEGLHAQLLTQAREAGVLDERQRMAREIHDTIAQGLAGIVTQLEAAEQARHHHGDWHRHVHTAIGLARESLTEARRSVRAIGPGQLAGGRLPDALADLVQRWSARHGVPARIATTGTVRRLSPEIEAALLRAAQEALANVAKHADAGRVGLTLSYLPDQVRLDVRDDGRGFPAAVDVPPGTAGAEGGFGLTGMRQRIHRVAGRLEIESEPGTGTAVSVSVPTPAGPPPVAVLSGEVR